VDGSGGGIAGRLLNRYSSSVGNSNTLFFRFFIDPAIDMIPSPSLRTTMTVTWGLTDRPLRDTSDFKMMPVSEVCCIRITRQTSDTGPIDLVCQSGPTAVANFPSSQFTNSFGRTWSSIRTPVTPIPRAIRRNRTVALPALNSAAMVMAPVSTRRGFTACGLTSEQRFTPVP